MANHDYAVLLCTPERGVLLRTYCVERPVLKASRYELEQDGFWDNNTMGKKEEHQPADCN